MLLAIHVGNTEMELGGFAERPLSFSRRLGTHPDRTADELALLFGGFLEHEGLSFSRQITGVAISSVVPSTTQALRDMTRRYFHFEPVVVEPGVKTGIAVLTDNPREVGADRIVNAIASFERYGRPCLGGPPWSGSGREGSIPTRSGSGRTLTPRTFTVSSARSGPETRRGSPDPSPVASCCSAATAGSRSRSCATARAISSCSCRRTR